MIDSARVRGGRRVTGHWEKVRPGQGGRRIVEEAKEIHARAIVMSLPPRRTGKSLFGKTLETVLAERPCRVIIDSSRGVDGQPGTRRGGTTIGRVERAYLATTRVLSVALLVLGLVMVVVALAGGGGGARRGGRARHVCWRCSAPGASIWRARAAATGERPWTTRGRRGWRPRVRGGAAGARGPPQGLRAGGTASSAGWASPRCSRSRSARSSPRCSCARRRGGRRPGAVAARVPVAGLFLAVTMATYVEGTSLHIERGGASTLARYAFDELWSFIAGWAILLDYLIVMAAGAVVITDYLAVSGRASTTAPSRCSSPASRSWSSRRSTSAGSRRGGCGRCCACRSCRSWS